MMNGNLQNMESIAVYKSVQKKQQQKNNNKTLIEEVGRCNNSIPGIKVGFLAIFKNTLKFQINAISDTCVQLHMDMELCRMS